MAIHKRPRNATGDALVDELMAQFDHGYRIAQEAFERMERIARAYGNKINTVQWPTISEISVPLTFISVEEQLPFAMKYLFPRNRWIELMPTNGIMTTDRIELVEDDLRYTLLTEMQVQDGVHRSVKDCYKYGVGYGLVETEWIFPEERIINELLIGGERVESIPTLGVGEAVQQVTYEYVAPIFVIPMPDGANVERPNKASAHFVVKLYPESKFRDMYARAAKAGNPMGGDLNEIVEKSRSLNFDQRMLPLDIIASLANINLAKTNDADRRIPVQIPVIRYYGDNHHVWIANGNVKIWEMKNKFQSMRSDLIKWSGWPDGNEWFPMGVTEASERLAWGTNVWYNSMIDLAMYHLNPTRVRNTDMIDPNKPIGRGPGSDVAVKGDATKAISYLKLPEFPQQLGQMGETLQHFHGMANAQPSSVSNASPGLVRGGTNALETLLSSTTGRQLLAGIAFKTGGMQPLVEKTLIKRQLMADKAGRPFTEKSFNADTGAREYHEKNVTLDDLRHIFRVYLNLPAARMNSAASMAERAGYFDRAQKKPELFDQRGLYEHLTDDYELVRSTMLPVNVVKEREARGAEAAMQSREAESQAATAPSTQGDQALAGAAAIGGEA